MGVYQSGQPIEINDFFTVDGVATDPTVLTYTILGPDGVTTVFQNGDPEVTNPDVGSWVLSLVPPDPPGTYFYDVDATGAVDASRSASFTVLPDVTVVQDPPAWAVAGPCTSWVDSQSVWDCCGQPMTTVGEGSSITDCAVDMTQYAFEASQVLFELSGRQFSGHCQRTVVACEERACGCGWQVLSRGYVVGPWDVYGWGWAGWWGDCWQWPCGCPSRLDLAGYPVREVTEVVIGGVTLAPTDYRLLGDRHTLIRTDGDRWPFCDVVCDEDPDQNTITYTHGMDPPLVGIHAASELACQFYKACAGQACDLPKGVTTVSRQGVTIERPAFTSWLSSRGWRTGMPMVDSFLSAFNPSGLKRRPVIWGPNSRERYPQPV